MEAVYVHNYIPEPQEVPGNVSTEAYPVRLLFIRRVIIFHALFTLICSVGFFFPKLDLPVYIWPLSLAVFLMGINAFRSLFPGEKFESYVSLGGLIIVGVLWSLVLGQLAHAGFPTHCLILPPLCLLFFILIAQRDFSFIGAFALSLVACLVGVSFAIILLDYSPVWHIGAFIATIAWLFYLVYDLAMLMHRRRFNDEWPAVLDLYRDMFNIFGWTARVFRHWRKHKIWTLPWQN